MTIKSYKNPNSIRPINIVNCYKFYFILKLFVTLNNIRTNYV